MSDSNQQAKAIAAYKEMFRTFLEKRPSGLRKKISDAIGTNRSFVSQITNPKYPVPIPSLYVHKIMAVIHLTPQERADFIAAYLNAHPGQAELIYNEPVGETHAVTIDLSAITDETERNLARQTLKNLAETMIALATKKGGRIE